MKTRHREGGPWRFLEAWGLNPYLRTWAAVHIERGAWQSWPMPAAPATARTRRSRGNHRSSLYAGV